MSAVTAQSEVSTMSWVNGVASGRVAISDRGLAYGDGVFETMRYQAGSLPLLPLHFERLKQSAQRLAIQLCHDQLNTQLNQVLADLKHIPDNDIGALKLILTRGDGLGYSPTPGAKPNFYWLYRPLSGSPMAHAQGIYLQISPIRLSRSALLGGLKHLNRLEYVLAAQQSLTHAGSQWLLLDDCEQVIEALTHNIFWVRDGILYTPELNLSGVAGIMRQWILQRAAAETQRIQIGSFSIAELLSADEVFICNSIRGVWPIVQIENTNFSPGPMTLHYQSAIESLWQLTHD